MNNISKIRIESFPCSKPSVKESGNIEVLFKIKNTTDKISKEEHDTSLCLLKLTGNMAKKYKDKISEKTYFKVTGAVKTAVTKKGMPFIIVTPVSLCIDNEVVNFKKAVTMNAPKMWFDDKEISKIDINDIVITNNEHLKTKELKLNTILYYIKNNTRDLTPMAVRLIDNGKYELIAGIKSFIIAKTLDIKIVSVHVTELCHEEFLEVNKIEQKHRRKKQYKNQKYES